MAVWEAVECLLRLKQLCLTVTMLETLERKSQRMSKFGFQRPLFFFKKICAEQAISKKAATTEFRQGDRQRGGGMITAVLDIVGHKNKATRSGGDNKHVNDNVLDTRSYKMAAALAQKSSIVASDAPQSDTGGANPMAMPSPQGRQCAAPL
eukprot:6200160-Pleurochrysis_carterae.AAC.1